MLVFIDESGDSGMKGKAGSSRLFVVTAILIEENEDAEQQIVSLMYRARTEWNSDD
jgi:hypothetical protein